MDHTSEKANPAEQNILLGDGVALIGSFLCAIWMLKNEEIVHSMPPLYAMTFIMFFSTIIITVLGLVIYGKTGGFTLSFDPHTGVFGFLGGGLKLASYVLLVYGFFTGACNMGAYSMSCKYFSPLVIGTAVLFEPIGSQIIGCLLGLDKIPGPLTFIGTAVTLAGLFFVSKGGSLNARQTHHL
jgi:drug/metabolite transporter (DMT)-like permease